MYLYVGKLGKLASPAKSNYGCQIRQGNNYKKTVLTLIT